ncbi:hypothetical protein C8U37_102161 [Trichococcus patagoniensis]|uniref:Uncharacterized protein n=1 Tax=Trichococcus patagoniensis TaxID=382641 RepID=A0A2T5IQG8_9LACT|nr:hypothetical protein C8U37_102161 [Trichococcus patagoniensis]
MKATKEGQPLFDWGLAFFCGLDYFIERSGGSPEYSVGIRA